MNSTMPRLAMLNSPSKLKARGSLSRAVLGDLAVVDVAGQLGRVLVLFVLGLEGADADAVLLGEDQAVDLDLVASISVQSPSYLASRSLNIVAAERAEVALDVRPRSRRGLRPLVELGQDGGRSAPAGSGAAAPRASGT